MKYLFVLLSLFFINCKEPPKQNQDIKVEYFDLRPFNPVARYIDKQLGVVCYYSYPGLSCLKLNKEIDGCSFPMKGN